MEFIKTYGSFQPINEGPGKGYYIKVAVRDAKKALAILDDMYRKKFDINGSNVYYFKDEDLAYDAMMDLSARDIEISDTNIEESLDENADPCWDDYKIGSPKTKISSKSGKRVNNCVPKNESAVNEAKFNFTEAEIKNAAETLAKAMAKSDKVKVEVHDFEYDKGRGAGFELSYDGDKYDGGSYYIKPNGDVINAAIKGGTKYGTIKSSEKDYLKYFKANESVVIESKGYKAGDEVELKTGETVKINQVVKGPRAELNTYRAKVKGKQIDFSLSDINESINEAEDYKYKKYVSKAFDKISDAMFEFRNAMGVKQLGQADPKLKKRLELMQAEIFALRRDMKSDGLTESSLTEATDLNDPVLMAFRATRKELPKFTPAKSKTRRLSFDKYLDLLDSQTDIDQDIKDYAEEIAQTFRDMEQEAEPEGGEIADKYGSIMMKQETEYSKLKAKKAKIDARIEKHRMA